MPFNPLQVHDAQAAMGFALEQHAHIEQQVNEAPMPEIQYPDLIDIDDSMHDFAKTVTYFSSDKYGRAKWINGNADDIPIAGTELNKHQTDVHAAGIGYRWGWEELGQAMMLGYPLQDSDAMAARRGSEEMIDRIVFQGDALKGYHGLMNHPSVAPANATNGNWAGVAVEDMILQDINDALLGVGTQTNYATIADTILLPHTHYSQLSTRRLGDTSQTLLSFLMANNAASVASMGNVQLRIAAVRGLETAGANGDARMIAYRRDPNVLKLNLPMMHRFLGVYQDGPLNWVVPGVFRCGGVDVRRPKEISYIDGI